ncbi:unnamed protein product [Rhodiola kirilowii]
MSSVTSRSPVFNLTTSIPRIPSVYIQPSSKVTRVSFPSARKQHFVVRSSAGEDKAEEARKKVVEAAGDAQGAINAQLSQNQKDADGLVKEIKEGVTSNFESMSEKAKEAGEAISDKLNEVHKTNVEMAEKAAGNVKEGGNKTAEAIEGAWDEAKDKAEKVKKAMVDG